MNGFQIIDAVHNAFAEKDAEIERLRAHNKVLCDNQHDYVRYCTRIHEQEAELAETRENAALMVRALDAALQWGEALFAWVPEGTTLPEGVKTAKGALDQAMNAIRSKQS